MDNKPKTNNRDRINVLCAFGTRPEAVKMSPLVLKLKEHPAFETKVLVTAQHREQLDSVLKAFSINPDYDLDIMGAGQTLTDITTKALRGMEGVLKALKPDVVLVHGDTSTTFAAALAAFYAGAAVGHVEAGLRTHNKKEPFPEEINRRLVACLADINFSPTPLSKENLVKENISPENIYVTGNTEIDAIYMLTGKKERYVFEDDALNRLDYGKKVIVMTAHRHENLGAPMESICRAVKRLIDDNEDCILVDPVHLNPEVRKTVFSILGGSDRICLTNPVGVCDMYNLIKKSYMVLTDSGGIQECAPALKKPTVVLRNVTERPEGVDAGVLTLAGTDAEIIYNIGTELIRDKDLYQKMASARNPFGDGKASERIIAALLHYFGLSEGRPPDFA